MDLQGWLFARVGFPKSRVYAKLENRLILKCYQTFNAYPLEIGVSGYNIGSSSIRQTDQCMCSDRATGTRAIQEMPLDEAHASGICHGNSYHG